MQSIFREMQPKTAIKNPQAAYRGCAFFINPNRPCKAGIQKKSERINSVAAFTEYSPFCQKKVEKPRSDGANISELN